jgi:uncharacterized integral membrane protein (TIGR00698 family)
MRFRRIGGAGGVRSLLAQAPPLVDRARAFWPGMALPALIALAATFISEHYGGPQLLYALLLGLAFHFLHQDARCRPGIEFCAKTLLRIGVALLGARITFVQIGQLGAGPLVVAVLGIASTILLGAWLARRFALGPDFGLLSGAAVSICGASAALAVAAVRPKSDESERQTLLTVVGVTGLSTLAMVFYPLLAKAFRLSDASAGIFLGGTIHDVAQVIGAGLTISHQAGDIAAIVKLFRVALLVPVVAALAFYWRLNNARMQAAEPGARAPLLPMFLVGFLALVLLNSAGLVAPAMADTLGQVSRACLLVAISALGIKTSFEELAKLGWRPVALMLVETLWLAALFLAYLVGSAR